MHWDGPNGCRCLDSQSSGGRCGCCGRCPACWQPVALLLALLLLLLGVVVQLILGLLPSLMLRLLLLPPLRLLLLPPLRLLLLPLNLPASIVEACLAQPMLPSARVPVPGCCL